MTEDTPTAAVYRRRPRTDPAPADPQQQAASAWDAAEAAGYEVVEIDGARLDDLDPDDATD
jgi:hypothetical protein